MLYGDARGYARFVIDLTCVALSPLIALLIRDNFDTSVLRLEALVPYAVICVLVAAVVFGVARLPHSLWRYTSLLDILHSSPLLRWFAGGARGKLLFEQDGEYRAFAAGVQWFLLIASMAGFDCGSPIRRTGLPQAFAVGRAFHRPGHVLIVA